MNKSVYLSIVLIILLLSGSTGIAVERFVSPDGSDEDGDGSEDTPWQTITYALQQNDGREDNLYIIHLAEGVYSESETGEQFPIQLESYLTLIGQDMAETIIDIEADTATQRRGFFGEDLERLNLEEFTLMNGKFFPAEQLDTSATGGAILISNSDNISLNRVRFRRNNATMGGAVAIDSTTNVTIESCEFSECCFEFTWRANYGIYGAGIYLTAVNEVSVINCLFENSDISVSNLLRGGGLKIDRSEYINIKGNTFRNNIMRTQMCLGIGIDTDNCSFVSIANNSFYELVTFAEHPFGIGIHVFYCDHVEIRGNEISNHHLSYRSSAGSLIYCNGPNMNKIVRNNNIHSNYYKGGSGIDVFGVFSGVIIRNDITDNQKLWAILTGSNAQDSDSLLIGCSQGDGNNFSANTDIHHDMVDVGGRSRIWATWNYFGDEDPFERVTPLQPDGFQITPYAQEEIEFNSLDLYFGPSPVEFGIVEPDDEVSAWMQVWNLDTLFTDTVTFELEIADGSYFNVPEGAYTLGFCDFVWIDMIFTPPNREIHVDSVRISWEDNEEYVQLVGGREYRGIKKETSNSVSTYSLISIYPNPFNSTTTITYGLPYTSHVSLQIYNPLGKRIGTLFEGYQHPGVHTTTLRAADLPSGLYFVQLNADTKTMTQKVMLIR